ncbi:MAG: helix-turn-helix transcriptional regulator [Clostridia bacterium]|nr:helix-turn-helix transcriptional regulator [Clostridia bacterium]
MEKKTMGAFLAALRKANGYTQQEVADKLNVSNKTISKWECDDGCPEIMMLPVIAELYSVTVDEILKGERITKTETETKPETTEKRAKYLIERALTKNKNLNVIAVTLSVVGAILPYFVLKFIPINYHFIPVIISVVLITAAIIITLIATNNLKSNLYSSDIINENDIKIAKYTAIKYLYTVIALSVTSVIGIVFVLLGIPFLLPFLFLPIILFITGIITYSLYFKYAQKENLVKQKTKEEILRRKKFIKVTAVICSIVVICSILLCLIPAYFNATATYGFSFMDGISYQYETLEEAEKEYYKIKNAIVDGKELYSLVEYNNIELSVTYQKIIFDIDKTDKGYCIYGYTYDSTLHKTFFETEEELEEFKKTLYNNDIEETDLLYRIEKDINFDDETLTISYRLYSQTLWNEFCEFFVGFFIVAVIIDFLICVTSVCLYFKKKS